MMNGIVAPRRLTGARFGAETGVGSGWVQAADDRLLATARDRG